MADVLGPRTRYCSRCLTTFHGDEERCPNLGCRSGRPGAGWGELLEPGETIDRTYRVHRRLAVGGAGVTYLTREIGPVGEEVGPLLAVKLLYQQRDQGPYLRRLATEAQILQGLAHPQIVEYRGFVHRTGHSPYLVTRFEEGGSLLDHLRRVGTLPIPITAAIGRQVCWALEVAHRQGVVHRDLKPENVLLVKVVPREQIPEIRVADFGIAKVFGGVGDRLTRVGAFVGTPQYAAPEQFDGLTPEPAADIYALGAMLLFCLTGRPVIDFGEGEDFESLKEKLVAALPPKLELPGADPGLVGWMRDALAALMAPEPGDRVDLSAIDQRLADLAAGRDPGFALSNPDARWSRTRSPHGAGRSDVGVESPGAPVVSTHTWGGSEPEAPTKPVVSQYPPRAPELRPPPARTAEKPRPGRGGLAAGLVGLLAAGLLLVGAAGAAWALWPREEVFVLTGQEADPGWRAEWRNLAGELGVRGVPAERACQAGSRLAVAAVVLPDGTLKRLDVLGGTSEVTRACLEKEVGRTPFRRTVGGTVKVSVTLPR